MRGRKTSILTITMLTAACMTIGGPAVAHTRTYDTEINHTGTTSPPLRFSGQISAPFDACFPNRTIVVTHNGADVGTTKTSSMGSFTVESSINEAGDYLITVKRKVVRRSSRHRHVCGAASVTVTR